MIYILYGPDTYRSRSVLAGVIKEFKKRSAAGVPIIRRIDAEEEGIAVLADEYRTPSFFGAKRLFIIERFFSAGDSARIAIEPLLEEWSRAKDLTVVFWDAEVSIVNKAFQAARAQAIKTQEFPLLSGAKLGSWLEKELLRRGITLSSKIKGELLDSSQGNLWGLINELAQLEAGFSFEKRGASPTDAKVWHFTDLFMNSGAKALGAAFRLIRAGEHELYILGALSKSFRSLFSFSVAIERGASLSAVGKALGLHQFAADKYRQGAARTSKEKIIAAHRRLIGVDENIKTGKLPAHIAFLNLFVRN